MTLLQSPAALGARQIPFSVWVTCREQKWVILRDRRDAKWREDLLPSREAALESKVLRRFAAFELGSSGSFISLTLTLFRFSLHSHT